MKQISSNSAYGLVMNGEFAFWKDFKSIHYPTHGLFASSDGSE